MKHIRCAKHGAFALTSSFVFRLSKWLLSVNHKKRSTLTYGFHFKRFSVFPLRIPPFVLPLTLTRYLFRMSLKNRDAAQLLIHLVAKAQTFLCVAALQRLLIHLHVILASGWSAEKNRIRRVGRGGGDGCGAPG